jgi:hypothetical protein
MKTQFLQDLAQVRQTLQAMEQFSWTSDAYQDAILNYLMDTEHHNRGVIEVGTFRGGLTCQLALACKYLEHPFYALDISSEFLKKTRAALQATGLEDYAQLFLGTLEQFAQQTRLEVDPVLIVVDASHIYSHTLNDIRGIYALNRRPLMAVFHDFSLRHLELDVNVEKAIADTLGRDLEMTWIGEAAQPGSAMCPGIDTPNPDGHYWNHPGTEGVLVRLPAEPMLPPLPPPPPKPGLLARVLRRLGRGA